MSTQLGRPLPDDKPYGEAWDLSTLPLHVSRAIEGTHAGRDLNEIWASSRQDLAGPTKHSNFPLLVKWLECYEYLSLQVHPGDEMARRVLHEPGGKSEAWIIISVEPNARVYAGLKLGVTRKDVEAHLKKGTLVDCLHSFTPNVGDCISLPAGTVHAAGGGLIIAEVQQSSDATFRLFDWNRVGLDGKPRPLQIERALEATDWDQGPIIPVRPSRLNTSSSETKGEHLLKGPHFQFERYSVEGSFNNPHRGEMTIWMVLDGAGTLQNPATGYLRHFSKGTTVVVPASARDVAWTASMTETPLTLLCVRLESSIVNAPHWLPSNSSLQLSCLNYSS